MLPPSPTQALVNGKITFTSPLRELQFANMVRVCEFRGGTPHDGFASWFEFLSGEITDDERSFSIDHVLQVMHLDSGDVQICYEGYVSVTGHEDKFLYSGCLHGPIDDPAKWQFEFVI